MPDDTSASAGSAAGGANPPAVFVPLETEQKHGELVKMVLASESMDDAERQYWIDILPIMTPDQLQQLSSILTQERDQLAAIDAKYAQGSTEPATPARSTEEIEADRKKRASERSSKEIEAESAEHHEEEEILKKVQDL